MAWSVTRSLVDACQLLVDGYGVLGDPRVILWVTARVT